MESTSNDAPQRSSSPTGQSTAETSSKRPAARGRHSSSWINRLHRHHDHKHHPNQDDARRPLLEDDRSDEEDEEAQTQAAFRQRETGRLRRLWAAIHHHSKKAYHVAANGVIRNSKMVLLACLLALLGLFVALCIGLYFRHKTQAKLTTCQSAACIHAASGLLDSLDPQHTLLDPCTQFDQMVCGGWHQRHDLRQDQGDMSTGTIMAEKSRNILRHILEETSPSSLSSSADQENFQKVKDEFDSCMDKQKLDKIGSSPLQDVVYQIKDAFPVSLDTAAQSGGPALGSNVQKAIKVDENNRLTEVMLLLIKLDIGALLSFKVQPDDRDPSSQILMISPPSEIGLPAKEYYDNPDLVKNYQAMSAVVLEDFMDNSPGNTTLHAYRRSSMSLSQPPYSLTPQQEPEDLAEDVVALEKKLAAVTPDAEDLKDVKEYYNPMTVAEADVLLPQISLDTIISEMAPTEHSPEKIIVTSPEYMKGLADILSETPDETLQASLVLKTVQQLEKNVEDPVLEPLRTFKNELRGLDPSATKDRGRFCVDAVDQDLGWITSKYYVEDAFPEASKQLGEEIATDVKESFVKNLEEKQWVSSEVLDRAVEKVDTINQKIGYPPDVLDSRALKDYYSGIDVDVSNFFENRIQAALLKTRDSWNKLGAPTPENKWEMTVPTVNAYYDYTRNMIVFPAGIMQEPVIYQPSVPRYLAYGAFGALSGHAVAHAVGTIGSQHDERGNFTEWFDEPTQEAFDQRAKCFERQYSKFTVESPEGELLKVNGKLTLSESIADAGGLHAAFSAWKKREAEQPSEALPGLQNFTPEQLFFMSFGRWWCDKSTKAKAVERLYKDQHPPKWARILGTVDNSAEFKKAFQCERTEPACKLW